MNRDDDSVWHYPERFLLAAFLLLLAWAPFPYGSNRPWAELALGMGLGGILLMWSGLALTGFVPVTPQLRRLALPALCLIAALGWGFVQSVNLKAFADTTGLSLVALAHPLWDMAGAALGSKVGAYVSVDPELTRQAVFAASLSIGAFLVAFELARDRDRAGSIVSGIVVIAFLYAAVALGSFYAKFDFQSWLMPDPKLDTARVTGPFVNPNHFATFSALAAIAGLGLFVEKLRQSIVWDRGTRLILRTGLQALTGEVALLFVMIVTTVSALLLTQSRGGVIAFFLGTVALITALTVGRRANKGESSGQRAMAALLVTVLGIAAAVSADPLLGRVQEQGVTDNARANIAQSTMKAIESAPLMGHGFGAFERYYPLFSDGAVTGNVDEAHNDILETFADLGIPAGLAYLAVPVILAWMCFQGCLNRRRDRIFPAIAFAASVVVGIHAAVEFSLQVPAVAVTYAALLGLGVAQSWRTNMDLIR
ncbi:MAG: O-antigen ligase family protein [Alphaproteobacteria bacterium]|nr:O-antigen ligase family protein [Alphaproteobacteria bacterium]